MGKATIKAAKGAGLYSVDIIYDVAAFNARKAILEGRIDAAAKEIDSLNDRLPAARLVEAVKAALLDDAIATKKFPLMETASKEWREAVAKLKAITDALSAAKVRKLAAEISLQTLLKSPPTPRTIDAWCADASDALSGDVGTIEICGEEEKGVLIVPGFESAAYDAAQHGLLRKREHCGPAEATLAGIFLPGWQKWAPTYRSGIISQIDGNNCTVDLDVAQSSAQGLNINQDGSVPALIDYMDCHGEAFEVGDHVLVMFQGQDWHNATVIGFEREPRECTIRGLQINDNGIRKYLKWDEKTSQWTSKAPVSEGLLYDIFTATNSARATNGDLRPFAMPSGYNVNPAQLICAIIRDTGVAYIEGMLPHESTLYPVGSQTVAERVDPYLANVTSFAENLLGVPKIDQETGEPVAELTGADLVDLWMNSPGHRANILGTDNPELNSMPTLLFIGRSEDEQMRYYAQLMATLSITGDVQGNIDWQGANGDVLNWRGVPGRYFSGVASRASIIELSPGIVYQASTFSWQMITEVKKPLPEGVNFGSIPTTEIYTYVTTEELLSTRIWQGGKVRQAPGYVLGACISGGKMCMVVAGNNIGSDADEYIYWADKNGSNTRGRTTLQPIGKTNRTPWFFNASGTEGVSVRNGHKWILSLDPVNESHVLTDGGLCSYLEGTVLSGESSWTVVKTPWETGPPWNWTGETKAVDAIASSTTTETLHRSVFDYIGDRMVELASTTHFQSVHTRTLTPTLYGYDDSVPSLPYQGHDWGSTYSINHEYNITFDGAIVATASSSDVRADALRARVGEDNRTEKSRAIHSTYIGVGGCDLRLGLITIYTKTHDDVFLDEFPTSDVWNNPEGPSHDKIESWNLQLSGHFNTIDTHTETIAETRDYMNWEDQLNLDSYEEDGSSSSPGFTRFEVADPSAPASPQIAGHIAKDNRSGKIAISTFSRFRDGFFSDPYHYLQDGDLTQHSSVPCNPICAV